MSDSDDSGAFYDMQVGSQQRVAILTNSRSLSWTFPKLPNTLRKRLSFRSSSLPLLVGTVITINLAGDVYHLFHLLLCRDDKRVYNVREKVFVKILSKILDVSEKEMITDLEQGDIGETTKKVFGYL
jgi:hypothetical protein